ncbi:glycoside hydrolase family 172 protein [Amycolatopsis sp. NPDC058986]|uniref:glycoside hydrolase family 172 protein n=1 Tax=unclassified Amycolatopsis TaxID=2618356 RepID=UPI00366ADF39
MTALSVVGFTATPAGAQPDRPPSPASVGPIGWDVYRSLDAMAALRPGAQSKQFSSFDRTGGNEDGFGGVYSCLRITAEGCVIAEKTGAGEIESMWFTRDYGNMVNNGKLKVELDGRAVLDSSLQDIVDGRLGAPFVWPLVGNGDDTSGGSVIKVPMPYQHSMRVTVQHNPLFYHVTYREFPDAAGVRTFDPRDRALDVVDRLRGFGIRDPKPAASRARTSSGTADIPDGGTAKFASLGGPGTISQLRVTLPQLISEPRVRDDGRAFGAGGHSSFRVAIDPANTGVRLTRRPDPAIGHQVADVSVDGKPAGRWTTGAPTPRGVWADQVLDLPPSLTAGKSALTITNTFVSSDLDINEFRYDVHSRVDGRWRRTDVLDLGPQHPGEEKAHGYQLTMQSWNGFQIYRYQRDPAKLAASQAVLSGARLRITFDGKTTVDSPLGEFFGSGLGKFDGRTMLSSIDATDGGALTAWWPMPYRQGAIVELVNQSGQPITQATVEVTAAPTPAVDAGLRPGGGLGYFTATSHKGLTQNGADWTILQAAGRGVFYGVTQSMTGLITSGNRRDYLEGDERVYVDGVGSPQWHGTGTEDFFESGWYFRDGTNFAMPLTGNPAYKLDGDGCRYDCTGAVRLMAGDAVPFSSALTFGIEHGPANNEPAEYSTTAYWYGQPDAGMRQTDLVDAGNDTSRDDHDYTAEGETRGTLTSTFEGTQVPGPVARASTASTGAVSFTMALDPRNAGARLLRIGDQNAAYQQAAVYVDGRQVGTWTQPLGNTTHRWLEDTFALPASVTGGRSSIDVRIVPAKGAPAWSAAQYRLEVLT